MKLEKLVLRNFRNHRDVELDLSADITVLYGRNGTGKTSVFDALELAFTGAVSRLGSEFTPQCKIALSDVRSTDDPVVRVEFGDDEKHWIQLTWDRHGRGQPAMQSDLPGRKAHNPLVFRHLLQRDFVPARKELRHLRELFGSTVFLSQEQMHDFVAAEPGTREHVLSTLAGSPDAQRKLEKARAVLALLRSKSEDTRQRLNELERGLGSFFAAPSPIVDSDSKAADALTELECCASLAGVTLPADLTDSPREFADHVRALYEERMRDAHAILARIATLEELTEQRPAIDEERRQVGRMLVELADRERSLQSNLESADATCKKVQEALSRANSERELAENLQRATTEQLRDVQQRNRRQALSATIDMRLARLRRRQAQSEQASAGLAGAVERETEHKRDAEVELASARERLVRLDRCAVLFERLPSISAQIAEIDRELDALTTRRAKYVTNTRELGQAISFHKQERDSLAISILNRKAQFDARSELVSRFLSEVDDDRCPLCGHAHGSAQQLLEAVRTAGGSSYEDLQQAEFAYSVALQRVATVESKLAENVLEGEAIALREQQLLAQRSQLTQSSESAQSEARALNSVGGLASIGALISDTKLRIAEVTARCVAADSKSATAQHALAQSQARQATLVSSVEFRLQQRERVLAKLESTGARAAQQGADSPLDAASLQTIISSRARTLGVTRRHIAAVEKELARAQALSKGLQTSHEALQVQIRDARLAEARCRDFTAQYDVLCRGLGLEVPAGREAILDLRHVTEERRDILRPVLLQAQAYARAAQAELRQARLAELEAALAGIRQDSARLDIAELRLRHWTDRLEREALDAIGTRVTTFRDDINSLFRAMVAFPEKFDSVVVADKDVQLGIVYHDDASELPTQPRYYLSSAELNALGLSVFLSLASSQQCFRLRCILLDDPIQHLDDLDTVAFLDTVRSIAVAPGIRRRQVVMSTCDQELYRLAVRKFSMLNREKMGAFAAISFADATEAFPVKYDVGGPAGVSLLPQATSSPM